MDQEQEIVRVMRVYVFEGTRKAIEAQLHRSLGDGTKAFGWKDGQMKIHVATIGSFPEILRMNMSRPGWADGGGDAVQPLGGRLVYVEGKAWNGAAHQPRDTYRAALASGADAILTQEAGASGNRVLYTLATFRETFEYGSIRWDEPAPPAAPQAGTEPEQAPPVELPTVPEGEIPPTPDEDLPL